MKYTIMARAGRIAVTFFIGSLLMQAAWILALPPFRGIDEFDHAFRAAAVAEGQWLPSDRDALNGRGNLQPVPAPLVRAAQPICERYDYTGRDNCRAVEPVDRDRVLIATAAGRYHPAFYWLIGTASKPFEGAAALYTMRATTAVLCAAFLGVAAFSVALWARSRWPYLGLLVAMTPVAVYSTSVAAPNGVEISVGIALWAALLGLTRPDLAHKTAERLIVIAVPTGMVLATVRQLGPLFLFLIVVTVGAMLGKETRAQICSAHKGRLLVGGLLTTFTSVANILWISRTGALTPEKLSDPIHNPVLATVAQAPVWIFQSIAAFPIRNQPAPTVVYACWLVVFTSLLILAFWSGHRSMRTVLTSSIVVACGLPLALSVMTISNAGPIWQGRYGLPYAVGICLISGLSLDFERGSSVLGRFVNPFVAGAGIAMFLAHTVSVWNVYADETTTSPLSGHASWIQVHPMVVVAVMSAGWLALWLAPRLSGAAQRKTRAFECRPGLDPADTASSEASPSG